MSQDTMTKPTVGRIVNYFAASDQSEHSTSKIEKGTAQSAIVADVIESFGEMGQTSFSLKLHVFTPKGDRLFYGNVKQGDEPGNWNWPTKV
jgi:hypothetical protein